MLLAARSTGLAVVLALALVSAADAQTAVGGNSSGTLRAPRNQASLKVIRFHQPGRFTGNQDRIDFESLSTGASVASLAQTHGVRFELVGGALPVTWDDPAPRTKRARSTQGGSRATNNAMLVPQPILELWPTPMPPLGGTGVVEPLPVEPALWIRFDSEISRVAFEGRSLEGAGAALVITLHRQNTPIETLYSRLPDGFFLVGAESSRPFDGVRIDLVNPQTGTLSIDDLRYEADFSDLDVDGIPDFIDTCPGLWNPGQEDFDGDGQGDPCDPFPLDPSNDEDGDGLPAAEDNCPTVFNPDQRDSDGDGIGDVCDALPRVIDSDGDGIEDGVDNCPLTANPNQYDRDGDGIGDVCDPSLLNPGVVQLTLSPGESTVVPIAQSLPRVPPVIDMVLMLDTTGSMGAEIQGVLTSLRDLVGRLQGLLGEEVDLKFSLVSLRDYPSSYTSCGYSGSYGSTGDLPYKVEATFSQPQGEVLTALSALSAGGGSDLPESYARALWEVEQPDSGLEFRAGSAHYVLLFGDDIPHDCDPSEALSCNNLRTTGLDPGRDEAVRTGDDIDFQDDALAGLISGLTPLILVYSGTSNAQWCAWQDWSAQTNGAAIRISTNARTDIDVIAKIFQAMVSAGDWQQVEPRAASGSGLTIDFDPPTLGPFNYAQIGGNIDFAMTVGVPAGTPVGTRFQETVEVFADGVRIGSTTVEVQVRSKAMAGRGRMR